MEPDRKISVTYMSGPQDGKILRFEQPVARKEIVLNIGRREGCDIYVPGDNQVSRLHARLGCVSLPVSSDAGDTSQLLTFWLEDAGSRNGTYIEKDAEPIKGRSNLRPGALFRIGRTWLRLDAPLSFEDDGSLF